MVKASSYYHDIYLEGLTPYKIKGKDPVGYKINFAYAFVNYLQKTFFSIKNNSEDFTYKFEFSNFGPLVFTPRVGHLQPLANKNVIVTFSSKTVQSFEKVTSLILVNVLLLYLIFRNW